MKTYIKFLINIFFRSFLYVVFTVLCLVFIINLLTELEFFRNINVGISSGASTPDELVKEVIKRISSFREIKIEKRPGIEENIVFKLPRELTNIEALN